LFTDDERSALAGFLAGYSGLTRDAYTLDLRQYTSWCQQHGLHRFTARRVDIECFGRDMYARGRARATIARPCTVTGFYRYAIEEKLLDHSPAAHVRRPRLDYESHAIELDRDEVGALLVAAGLGAASEHALISLLAINGLRISEALGADIETLGLERGHRTLTVLRKMVTIRSRPGPRVRSTWPSANASTARSSYDPTGSGWTGTARDGSCAASPAELVSTSRSDRTPCATPSSPPRSTPASRWATFKKPPRTPTHAHHALRPSQSLARPPRHLHRRRLPRRSRTIDTESPRLTVDRCRLITIRVPTGIVQMRCSVVLRRRDSR
jgi:hypothetical protein